MEHNGKRPDWNAKMFYGSQGQRTRLEQMPPNITALNYISRFWRVGMMIE